MANYHDICLFRRDTNSGTIVDIRDQYHQPTLYFDPSLMHCCGSAQASGWSNYRFTPDSTYSLDRLKQDFLWYLLSQLGTKTLYYIATDEQYREWNGKECPLNLLAELGSKQVDHTKNKNYDESEANQMILHVWCWKENEEALKKYVTWGESGWLPNWWEALSEKERREYEDPNIQKLNANFEAKKKVRFESQQSQNRMTSMFQLARMNEAERLAANRAFLAYDIQVIRRTELGALKNRIKELEQHIMNKATAQ